MPERFVLVFEGGARNGERVPVPGERFTIGRRPGNSLVVADSSVSGAHCELRALADGWLLKDVGSTNGTFFGGAKILEARIAPGDRFAVGSVILRVEPAGEEEIVLGDEAPAIPAADRRPTARGSTTKTPVPAAPEAPLELVEDADSGTILSSPAARSAASMRTAPVLEPATDDVDSEGLPLVADAATVDRARRAAEEAAKKGRRGAWILGGVAVAALAAAGVLVMTMGGDGGPRARAVVSVQGNLLEQPHFEADAAGAPAGDAWELQDAFAEVADLPDGLVTGFSTTARRPHTGTRSISVRFDGAGVARAVSRPVRVPSGQRVHFAAHAATGEGNGALVVLSLRAPGDAAHRVQRAGGAVWGSSGSGYRRLEGAAVVPTGCTEAVLQLVAFGTAGTVDFDDAALVVGGEEGIVSARAQRQEIDFEAEPLGGRTRKIDHDLFHGLSIAVGRREARAPIVLGGRTDEGFTVFTPSGPVARVDLRLEPGESGVLWRWRTTSLAAEPLALVLLVDRAYAPEILVRGATARWSRGDFEEERCAALVMGDQRERIRLAFEPSVAVRGVPQSTSTRLEVDLPAELAMNAQFSFDEEKRSALDLERQADAAEAAQAWGESIGLRTRILAEYPFDKALVERNEARRDERVAAGQKAVAAIERRVAEAEFFQLPEAFREARADAERLAASYAGTDVAERARLVIDQVGQSLSDVEARRGEKAASRLATIARAFAATGARDLSDYVREYVKTHFSSTEAARGLGD